MEHRIELDDDWEKVVDRIANRFNVDRERLLLACLKSGLANYADELQT